MSLNPTAPAFSPPASIPRVASDSAFISTLRTAESDHELDLLDLDLDLALDLNHHNPTPPVLEASKLASALLGESFLKALLQSSMDDDFHNEEDDDACDAPFPSSPLSQCSSMSPGRDIWSPTSDYFATSSSTPETTYSLLTTDFPGPDEEACYAASSPASSSNDTWSWNEDWKQDEDSYDSPSSDPEPISYATETCGPVFNTAFTTSLNGITYLIVQQQPSQWQQQEDFLQTTDGAVPGFSCLGYPPQPQFLITPPSPRVPVDTLPSSNPTGRGLAPLWPLLSALQRNLSRSRPDLYGSLPSFTSSRPGMVGSTGVCG